MPEDTDAVSFDYRSSRLIGRTVRDFARIPDGRPGDVARKGRPQVETITAKLTDVDGDDFEWDQVERHADGTWEVLADSTGRTGTFTDMAAYQLPGAAHAVDEIVLLRRTPVLQDDGTYEVGWLIVGTAERGGLKYQVKMTVDDFETVAWEYPRFA